MFMAARRRETEVRATSNIIRALPDEFLVKIIRGLPMEVLARLVRDTCDDTLVETLAPEGSHSRQAIKALLYRR